MLDDAADFVRLQTAFYIGFGTLFDILPANVLGPPRSTVGGLSSQWSTLGHFELTPQSASIVTVKPASQASYQGFELASPWLQSLEFIHHQSSLNVSQADQFPITQVVPVSQLRAALPADTSFVSQGDRERALRLRARGAERRLRNADTNRPELLRRIDQLEELVEARVPGLTIERQPMAPE